MYSKTRRREIFQVIRLRLRRPWSINGRRARTSWDADADGGTLQQFEGVSTSIPSSSQERAHRGCVPNANPSPPTALTRGAWTCEILRLRPCATCSPCLAPGSRAKSRRAPAHNGPHGGRDCAKLTWTSSRAMLETSRWPYSRAQWRHGRGRSCVGAVTLERDRVVDLLRAVLCRDVRMEGVQCIRAATHVDGPGSERRTEALAENTRGSQFSNIPLRVMTILTRSR